MPIEIRRIEIRRIDAAQTHRLRGVVLRPGGTLQDLIYEGDEAPETQHFGAFDSANLVGIASVYRENWALDPGLKAYRLRGMAVDLGFRRRGVGADLIRACLAHLETKNGEVLWFNARVVALVFYASLGFERVGKEFEIVGVGPHFLMFRRFAG